MHVMNRGITTLGVKMKNNGYQNIEFVKANAMAINLLSRISWCL